MDKDTKYKWITIRVIIEKMLIEAFMLGLITFIVYNVIKDIYSINLFTSISSILKPIPSEALTIIFILIISKNFNKRYKFHRMLDVLENSKNKYENPKARIEWSIANLNGQIDSLKLKVDILKSFSPIPILILFIGNLFEKGTFINLNSFSITVLVIILVYFASLMNAYNQFVTIRKVLVHFEQEKIKLENENFFDQKIRTPNNLHNDFKKFEKSLSKLREPSFSTEKKDNSN
ncbi:hypothetical protein CN543_01470 [Bacillus toyonensis]|uniref:hypothetical protein n=1 Tax=Bacillus toyonensis TaxID=155322 RepID=UPI000BF0E223|nr:hypothetical protein [Bacillus toyonensis]PEN40854.1 hypothetical protein CN543_01470 [Bacillus toyonensis]PEO00892.1 hypothetical protein CN561_26045 [Bacillus toyonensis]